MVNAQRDENRVTANLAESSADDQSIVTNWADPVTHRLLVDSALSSPLNSNGNVQVSLEELNYVSGQSGIDSATESLITVDYAHHEIHSGSHYYVKGFMDLTNGQVFDFLAVTPNTTKWIHMLFEASFEAEASIQIYEGTTTSANGTAVPMFNRDRNSSNTPGMLLYHTPTVTTPGTQIAGYKTGSGNKVGGEARGANELILKQNTKYLIRTTNNTALNNWFDYLADWYEHTNKN